MPTKDYLINRQFGHVTSDLEMNDYDIKNATIADIDTARFKKAPFVDVTHPDFGAKGDGATDDTTAISDAIAEGKDVYFPDGTYLISSNLTVPSGQDLIFAAGAKIKTDAGTETITVNGEMQATLHQCFNVSSGDQVVFSDRTDFVYSEWFGAVGDGSTNDHDALEKAGACAVASTNGALKLTDRTYATSENVAIPSGCDILMDGTILYTGISDIPILTVGTASTANVNRKLKIRVERQNRSDGSSENNIGVKLYNVDTSRVDLDWIVGNTIGASIIGDNNGVAYNTFTLERIVYNLIGIDLVADDSVGDGWVNENLFLGGRIASGPSDESLDRTGIRIRKSATNSRDNPNNNLFIKPSLELGAPLGAGGVCYGLHIQNGNRNEVISCRSEKTDYLYKIDSDNGSNHYNVIEDGYGNNNHVDNSIRNLNTAKVRKNNLVNENYRLIYRSPHLGKVATPGHTTIEDYWNIPGLYGARGSKDDERLRIISGQIPVGRNYIALDENFAPSIFLTASQLQRFIIALDIASGSISGHLTLTCYDASGNVLDGSSTQLVHTTSPGSNFSWADGHFAASPGGSFYISANSVNGFTVDDAVDRIAIHLECTTNLRGFAIYAPAEDTGFATVWNGMSVETDHRTILDDVPTWGRVPEGQIIWNDSPSAGGDPGWVCVNRDDQGVKAAISATDTTVDIDDTSNMTAGDVIGFELDDGSEHWTSISSVVDVDTITVNDAFPSSAAIGNSVWSMRWKAMSNLDA